MIKIPIYLLVDTSASMLGVPLEAVRNGLRTFDAEIRGEAGALVGAYLSVIAFASHVEQVVPLTMLNQFLIPEISAHGDCSLGSALTFLAGRANQEMAEGANAGDRFGRPIVFLMSDFKSTDELADGIDALKQSRIGKVIGCPASQHADMRVLSRITASTCNLADKISFLQYFRWLPGRDEDSFHKSSPVLSDLNLPLPPACLKV